MAPIPVGEGADDCIGPGGGAGCATFAHTEGRADGADDDDDDAAAGGGDGAPPRTGWPADDDGGGDDAPTRTLRGTFLSLAMLTVILGLPCGCRSRSP